MLSYIDNVQQHHYDSNDKMSSSSRLQNNKENQYQQIYEKLNPKILTLLDPRVISPDDG